VIEHLALQIEQIQAPVWAEGLRDVEAVVAGPRTDLENAFAGARGQDPVQPSTGDEGVRHLDP
jgi:hypothetical protein